MDILAKKILQNKSDYRNNLDFLDEKYFGVFSQKLNIEKNHINILSLFSEMEFGFYLNQKFSEVLYEPKISGKTPDWVVKSEGQNLIFEVKKINSSENELRRRIDLFLRDEYDRYEQTSYTTSIEDFRPQLHKIISKEETYRTLILEQDFKLVICIDVINLQKEFITDTDLRDYLDFENKYSILAKHSAFRANISGILGKPVFGDYVYIDNKFSEHRLNAKNLDIMTS